MIFKPLPQVTGVGRISQLIAACQRAGQAAVALGVFAARVQLHGIQRLRLVGLALMQYLTNWRMQCGARLLRESHASVAAVALEVGYDSEAAFSRAFKRATEMPPGAWRRAQLQSA